MHSFLKATRLSLHLEHVGFSVFVSGSHSEHFSSQYSHLGTQNPANGVIEMNQLSPSHLSMHFPF